MFIASAGPGQRTSPADRYGYVSFRNIAPVNGQRLADSQPTVLVPSANVAWEFLHTTGTLSYPKTQFSGRTGNVPSHLPQARFSLVSDSAEVGAVQVDRS